MKIFLTGASGLLGHALAESLKQKSWEVHVSACHNPVKVKGVHVHRLDLTDGIAIKKLVSGVRPEAIIHAAALSRPADCQSHPALSRTLNVEAPRRLAKIAKDRDLRFVHYSTDMVFDGKTGDYHEGSPTHPTQLYGEHKLEAETGVLETCPASCVLRLPLLTGNSPSGDRSVHEALWSSWKQNRATPLFEDEWRSPVSISNVAKLTVELVRNPDIRGLHHWCGATSLSRWDMGRRIAVKFGVPDNLLRKVKARGLEQFKNRPLMLTMDCSQLAALVRTRPPSFKEQLREMVLPDA